MTENRTSGMSDITSASLPAILVGGPPNSGKSVLTYNLTNELRRREVPHYVFRANPDGEGDWFLKGDPDTVRQIHEKSKSKWSDTFRRLTCDDLPKRQLPLLVDLGGLPTDKDNCIFQICRHSILLLRDDVADKAQISQTWRDFTVRHNLTPLAEIQSRWSGSPALTLQGSVIKGSLVRLDRDKPIINRATLKILVDRIATLFSEYTPEELEQWHLSQARSEYPQAYVVNLPVELTALAPDTQDWEKGLLQDFLSQLAGKQSLAVYGRGPAWLYAALALHSETQPPFYQFDARLGWVTPPSLQPGTPKQSQQSILPVPKPFIDDDMYVIELYPKDSYLDYSEAHQLVFPEPPVKRGVIISGKLPLWLFTALARFYAQYDVPWIALNEAHDNKAVVIYSRLAAYPVGKKFPTPV